MPEETKESKWWDNWWAVFLGFILILFSVYGRLMAPVLPGRWGAELTLFEAISEAGLGGILLTGLITMVLFGLSIYFSHRKDFSAYLMGFPLIFSAALLAEALGNYAPLRHYGLNNVIWALALGLFISNILQGRHVFRGAVRTELYIKTGLVLLGASVLFNRMLSLGLLGLGVAWLVTPVVLIFMYWYSQRFLDMKENRGLAVTIASAASVCGVSAAIATGAASKSKKEEISLAISITLIFTVLMMVGLPALARLAGMEALVGGAWLGGTIDATGAVVAAGALLGDEALEVASIIKMIQNILIGIIAFGVAVYWVTVYEGDKDKAQEIDPREIWRRLPKFIIGFVLASVVFSFLVPEKVVESTLPVLNSYRSFFFTLAFVSIGLDSNLGEMTGMLKSGKPLTLYIMGQGVNLLLTFIAAYIFFSGRFFILPF